MPPSHKTITAVMTTNRITSLQELLHYRPLCLYVAEGRCCNESQGESIPRGFSSFWLFIHKFNGCRATLCGSLLKKRIEEMYRLSIEYKHERKLGRRKTAVVTCAQRQESVSTAFSSSPKLSPVFLKLDRNLENKFLFFRKYRHEKGNNLFTLIMKM